MLGIHVKLVALSLVTAVATVAVAVSGESRFATPAQLRASLVRDMTLRSERLPAGLPPAGYAVKPRITAGNSPGDFTAFTAWGQLFTCAHGNRDPSARVEIRGMQGWILSRKTHHWTLVQSSPSVNGHEFLIPYLHNESVPANTQKLADGGLAVTTKAGEAYIFWPASYSNGSHKATIDPSDVLGVATIVRARLAPIGSQEQHIDPCYVMSAGADYWLSAVTPWQPKQKTDIEAGVGRFKMVKDTWQLYTMTTASTRSLKRYPLPIQARLSELE